MGWFNIYSIGITLIIICLIGFGAYYFSSVPLDIDLINLFKQNNLPYIYQDLSGYQSLNHNYSRKYETIYGEIYTDGIKRIYDLAKDNNINFFLDLGCGIGKGVVVAKLVGFEKAYGVELVRERVQAAIKANLKLPSKIRKDVHIYQGDLLDYNLQQFDTPICIFISNLLFTSNTNVKMFHKIANEAPDGSIVVSSAHNISPDDVSHFKCLRPIITPMSWCSHTLSYVFKVQKPQTMAS